MTDATGTVKGHALIKTRCIVENLNPTANGVIATLRPEWDDTIRENQLAMHGERLPNFVLTVPTEAKGFFEVGKPYYLEFTKI